MDALSKKIQYFLETANCLNFSKAAENLFVTQQAVTHQISEFENELGAKLFTRTTRSVHLTQVGAYLRDELGRINRECEIIFDRANTIASADTTHITIGIFSSFKRAKIIVPIMQMLRLRFPDVIFVLKLYSFAELRNHIQDGELDICIATCIDWKKWKDVSVIVMDSSPLKLVCSKDHPLASEQFIGPLELGRHLLFKLPSDTSLGWREPISRLPNKNTVEVPNMDVLLVYLESGAGFSVLTDLFEGADNGTLVFRDIDRSDQCADSICAYRSDSETPLLKEIAESIKDYWGTLDL